MFSEASFEKHNGVVVECEAETFVSRLKLESLVAIFSPIFTLLFYFLLTVWTFSGNAVFFQQGEKQLTNRTG